MPREFTDTENTGAPLVPMIETATTTDGDQAPDHEEAVLSHRIQN